MNLAYYHTRHGRPEESLRLLDRARQLLDAWTADHPADLWSRVELGRVYVNLGYLYHSRLHDYPQALHYYDQARRVQERLSLENPTVTDYRWSWAGSCLQMCYAYKHQGRWDKTLESARQAHDLLEPLRRADSDDLKNVANIGFSDILIVEALRALRRTDGLHDALEEARTVHERLYKAHPHDFNSGWGLEHASMLLGAVQSEAGQPGPAGEAFARATEVLEGMASDFRDQPRTLHGVAEELTELGEQERRSGRPAEARKCLEQARGMLQPLHDAHPEDDDYTDGLAAACLSHGALRLDANEREEAGRSLREARGLLEGLPHPQGEDLMLLAEVRCQLARLSDDPAERGDHLKAAGDALRRAFAAGCVDMAEVKDSPYLFPLRQGDGFAELLAELQKEADRRAAEGP
jgi:tetratricopeptide (TPR) repeat protein